MTIPLPSIAKMAELLGGDVRGAEVLVLVLDTAPLIVACPLNLTSQIAKAL